MRVLDIVIINDMDVPAIVEAVTAYDDMTIYSVRMITGDLFSREADELTAADDEVSTNFRSDLGTLAATGTLHEALVPVQLVKSDGAIITAGVVAAEIAATESARATLTVALAPMAVIGINASTNMYA